MSERAPQINYKTMKSALMTGLVLVGEKKITMAELTAHMADQIGQSLDKVEAAYKRFKAGKYKAVLPVLPYALTGEQGRPSVSKEELEADAAELAALMAAVSN